MARTLTLLQAGARDVDYFRLYADIIDNPKFAAAPEDGGMSADTFRFWIWSLCIASGTSERDGRLPPITEIAFRCRMTVQQADAHLTTLQARKLVARDTNGNATVVGWSTFQPLVPKSTQRVRKHRATHKTDASSTAKIAQSLPRTDETFHETHETRCETFLKRYETPLIDREKPPSESLSSTHSESQPNPPQSATTPQPPSRPGVGGVGGIDDDEPFAPPPDGQPDETDPPDVAAVTRLADELFPAGGMATAARAECLRGTRPAWIAEALRIARDKHASRWAYVASILRRFAEAGMSDSERPRPRASPDDGLTPTQRRRGAKIDEWLT